MARRSGPRGHRPAVRGTHRPRIEPVHHWPLVSTSSNFAIGAPPPRNGAAEAARSALFRAGGGREEPRGLPRDEGRGEQGHRRRRPRWTNQTTISANRLPRAGMAGISPRPMPRPTSLFSEPAPTPSGWSISRRCIGLPSPPSGARAGRHPCPDGTGMHGGGKRICALDDDLETAIQRSPDRRPRGLREEARVTNGTVAPTFPGGPGVAARGGTSASLSSQALLPPKSPNRLTSHDAGGLTERRLQTPLTIAPELASNCHSSSHQQGRA